MSLAEEHEDEALVRYVAIGDGVARIEMVDATSGNGLSGPLVSALIAALSRAEADATIGAVVLCGLEDMFCSGATLDLLEELRSGGIRPLELGLADRLLALEVPVVAACRGAAVGGGFALALASDVVVLAAKRRYGFNFMDLGITPGMGTTRLAAHFLGLPVAQELLLTGELRRGRDFSGGGINHVVPTDEVEPLAMRIALRMATKSRTNLSLLKRTLALPRRRALLEGMTLESLMHETSLASLDLTNFGGAES